MSSEKCKYASFLKSLLVFESGIDPSLFNWYVTNYDNPVIMYPEVINPGRVIRDQYSGQYKWKKMSIREYFSTLGVLQNFDIDDPSCLITMQYQSMNILGFIGYQVGEWALSRAGYYIPKLQPIRVGGDLRFVETYYIGIINDSEWTNGRKEIVYNCPTTNKIILATDINTWQGKFTGKDGLNCINDLFIEEIQEKVIRRLMVLNYQTINENLIDKGYTIDSFLCDNLYSATNLIGRSNNKRISLSGMLAAAHLCGAKAVVDYLISDLQAVDEFGTTIENYITKFSNYQLSFCDDRMEIY